MKPDQQAQESTSLVACESGKLDDVVTVTYEMVNTIGTSLGLREGDKISLYDLVIGMLLVSGNDAANSVAIYLGGSIEGLTPMQSSIKESSLLWLYTVCFESLIVTSIFFSLHMSAKVSF